MKQILALSADPKQAMTVILDDGSKLTVSLEYIQANKGWYISIAYGSVLEINMRRVVASPNIIRAHRNVVDFGIACVTTDGHEPIYKDDFSSGRAALYVLNSEDVDYVEETVIPAYRE